MFSGMNATCRENNSIIWPFTHRDKIHTEDQGSREVRLGLGHLRVAGQDVNHNAHVHELTVPWAEAPSTLDISLSPQVIQTSLNVIIGSIRHCHGSLGGGSGGGAQSAGSGGKVTQALCHL